MKTLPDWRTVSTAEWVCSTENFFRLTGSWSSCCWNIYAWVWIDTKGLVKLRKEFAVSYHCALKKIFKFPKRFSSLIICTNLENLLFEHFLKHKVFKFEICWVIEAVRVFFSHKIHFLKRSLFKLGINRPSCENYRSRDIARQKFLCCFCQTLFSTILWRVHFICRFLNRFLQVCAYL